MQERKQQRKKAFIEKIRNFQAVSSFGIINACYFYGFGFPTRRSRTSFCIVMQRPANDLHCTVQLNTDPPQYLSSFLSEPFKYAEEFIMRGLASSLPRILCQQQRKATLLSEWRLRLDCNPIILFQWGRFLYFICLTFCFSCVIKMITCCCPPGALGRLDSGDYEPKVSIVNPTYLEVQGNETRKTFP